ncbi:EamA family transporter [Pedobacter sp. MW01-1-1]|uniref:EamA family transporter n=1 Tax=Pedobacter sp. MW01-1-1 TaxID=3383027 RepID=UPI003FEE46B8
MLFIVLSVICSVTVAILLKLAKRYQINIIQAVTLNYLTALLLCFAFFRPTYAAIQSDAPWLVYGGLGILLPSIFLVLAASVKNVGIVKTDIAQRLSLFIPILAAYFIFQEDLNRYKITGLVIGFAAILFTFLRKSTTEQSKNQNWLYLLAVFFGFGLIDVLFKQIALYKAVPYTTSLSLVFGLSLVVSIAIMAIKLLQGKAKLQLVNIACGVVLGLFNFGNILFYLKAHQAMAKNPSTVFAAMNLGVIVVGSLIGIFIFKEKLSKLNYVGLVLALVAVVLITLSQMYAV